MIRDDVGGDITDLGGGHGELMYTACALHVHRKSTHTAYALRMHCLYTALSPVRLWRC